MQNTLMFLKNENKYILLHGAYWWKTEKNLVGFLYTRLRVTVSSNVSDKKEFKGIEIFLYSKIGSGSLMGPFIQK